MAFVVKKINLDDLNSQTGEFTHELTGITLTLKSFSDTKFQKAHDLIMSRNSLDMQELKTKALDDSFLDSISEDGKSVDELMLQAIGKFLVVDWNAEDEAGEKLEVTAENFVLLTANIPMNQQSGFVQWCFNKAADVSIEHVKSLSEAKKKPLRGTSGKKTTQA